MSAWYSYYLFYAWLPIANGFKDCYHFFYLLISFALTRIDLVLNPKDWLPNYTGIIYAFLTCCTCSIPFIVIFGFVNTTEGTMLYLVSCMIFLKICIIIKSGHMWQVLSTWLRLWQEKAFFNICKKKPRLWDSVITKIPNGDTYIQ